MAQGAGGVAIGRRRDDQPPSEEAARETGRNQDLEVCNPVADGVRVRHEEHLNPCGPLQAKASPGLQDKHVPEERHRPCGW